MFEVGFSELLLIFAIALVVLGSVVAYLVQRVRTLSNFYGRPV